MGAILDHLVREVGLTLAEAKDELVNWEIRPIESQGKQVGELMIQNNEVHFALNKEFRRRMGRGKLMRSVVDGLVREKGFIVTKLFPHDPLQRLIERMGFRKTHSDSSFQYFWLDKETQA
jgi:hypothetical protein